MRENRVNLTRYGISRYAYQELKAFCRQYPEKKAMAEACIMPGASERIGSGGGLPGDPVSRAAAARERYLRDTDTIDHAARDTGGGQWARALVLNACYGVGYEYLDPAILPSSNRNAFFQARREFFWRLYHLRFDTFGAVKT